MRFTGEHRWDVPKQGFIVEGFAPADLVGVAAEPGGKLVGHGLDPYGLGWSAALRCNLDLKAPRRLPPLPRTPGVWHAPIPRIRADRRGDLPRLLAFGQPDARPRRRRRARVEHCQHRRAVPLLQAHRPAGARRDGRDRRPGRPCLRPARRPRRRPPAHGLAPRPHERREPSSPARASSSRSSARHPPSSSSTIRRRSRTRGGRGRTDW